MSKKTFNISSQLYPQTLIEQVISVFHGYSITHTDGTLMIDDEDPQYVFDEFANYTLSIYSENSVGV